MTDATPLRIAVWSLSLLSLCTGSWLPLIPGITFAAAWIAGCIILDAPAGTHAGLHAGLAT